MKLYYIAIATLFSMFASVAHAGTTSVIADTGTDHKCQIKFEGTIESGDQYEFNAELFLLDERCDENVLVIIESPGGHRGASISMYEAIERADADTYVETYAASGGAIMWLAGDTRYMTRDADIAFHFAYMPSLDDYIDTQLYHIIANFPSFFADMTPWDRKDFIDQLRRDLAQDNTVKSAWDDMKFYMSVNMLDSMEFIDRLVEEGVGSVWFLPVTKELATDVIGNVVYVEDIVVEETVEEEVNDETTVTN